MRNRRINSGCLPRGSFTTVVELHRQVLQYFTKRELSAFQEVFLVERLLAAPRPLPSRAILEMVGKITRHHHHRFQEPHLWKKTMMICAIFLHEPNCF